MDWVMIRGAGSWGFLCLLLLGVCGASRADFIRPQKAGEPLIYGVPNGICIAVYPDALDGRPQGGPRGLIRVGYQESGKFHLLNYIAVQPLVDGATGLSELERGADGKPGKPFRIGSSRTDGGIGQVGDVSGAVQQTPEGATLTFCLFVEKFANGAAPVIEISLFENQPDRVRFRTYSGADGKPMERCDLSATMGNQSRCRCLWLDTAMVYAPMLYAGYHGTDFVERAPYRLDRLHKTMSGDVVAAISPDEFEPREVWPFDNGAWRHDGPWMAQFWLKPNGTYDDTLQCRVNGRRTYWAGNTPIPGGIPYENFELQERFRAGQETWFGYCAESPAKRFGFGYDAAPTGAPARTVSDAEKAALQSAMTTGRKLTDGDFSAGLTGWEKEGGADKFRVVSQETGPQLTTFGTNKEAEQGRLYQCFQVPADAVALRFRMSGGVDAAHLYVALWSGDRLVRKMTARDDNVAFGVRWSVENLRGQFVTLEIVDKKAGPWGFLAVEAFSFDDGAP